MTEETVEEWPRTLVLEKKGRKYFACTTERQRNAQLVIDEVTRDLVAGDVVTIRYENISVHTSYGSTIRFRAVEVVEKLDPVEYENNLARRYDAAKWVNLARHDLDRGMSDSNAIRKAFEIADGLPRYAEELPRMREQAARNEAQWWVDTAIEDIIVRQWTHSSAITKARRLAPQFPDLAALLRNADVRAAARTIEATAEQPAAAPKAPRTMTVILSGRHAATSTPFRFRGEVWVITAVVRHNVLIESDDIDTGGGHLIGREGERGTEVVLTAASPQQVAAVEAVEKAARQRDIAAAQRYARIRVLRHLIETEGERPAGTHQPDGEQLLGAPTLYGGGEWFVLGAEHIWSVCNNGADGDDWSRNNVRTAGAGAIGWRIPYREDIAAELRALAAEEEQQ